MSSHQPPRVEKEVHRSQAIDVYANAEVQPFPLSSKFDFQSRSSDWQQSNSYGEGIRFASENHHERQSRENRQFPRDLHSSSPNNAAYDESSKWNEHHLPDSNSIERHVPITTGDYAAYSNYRYHPHWQQQATGGEHWYPGVQHYQHIAQHRYQFPYAEQHPATYEEHYHRYGDEGQQHFDGRGMFQGQSQQSHHQHRHNQPRKRKRKRDESEPKRALTAYNFFFKRQRAIMLFEDTAFEEGCPEEHGKVAQAQSGDAASVNKSSSGDTTSPATKKNPRRKVGFAEMARRVSKSWQEASDKEKLEYRKLADQDKVRYDTEKAAYDATRARAREDADDPDPEH